MIWDFFHPQLQPLRHPSLERCVQLRPRPDRSFFQAGITGAVKIAHHGDGGGQGQVGVAQTLEVLDVDAFDTHGLLHTQVHVEVAQRCNDLVGVVDGQGSFGFKLDHIVVSEAKQ